VLSYRIRLARFVLWIYGQALLAGIFLCNAMLVALVLVQQIRFANGNRRALVRSRVRAARSPLSAPRT
jgi:uncharacterized protein (DUF58 family)